MSVATVPAGPVLPATVVPVWAASPAMGRVRDAARNRLPFVDVAVSGGARSFVVAGLVDEKHRASAQADRPSRPILLVTATTREADDLAEGLGLTTEQFEQTIRNVDLFLVDGDGPEDGFLDNINVIGQTGTLPGDAL